MNTSVITGRRRPTKPKKQARIQKRKRSDVDVEKLQQAVDNLDPKAPVEKFTDLPLSDYTKTGLKACHFSTLTDIQKKAIAAGLKGSDILGAAKTGSGKTLAFLIPVLENLYRQSYVGQDAGLGAMIISPTRELAIQIFDVLRKIGKHGHMFAAGLVIGGKSLREEQDALVRMNIIVCTPGRMLQHLSQTAAFNVDNLQMLVLDEADRILDMGFQRDVDAIIDYLPKSRQTLLFSATQTKKVSDLARLSLQDPEYISVHEVSSTATPQTLQQNYTLTPLPTKLDTLWSFLQSAKKSKTLVFLSSGKQVRFVFETFRKMQPGVPLLHLHGRQKQNARLEITSKFTSAQYACLFSTDLAARGLDFPAVDWVVQVDCPEDADTYIHRVGRTARYEHSGRAVLFLDPSEEAGMLERLIAKNVPVERINVRAKKQSSIKEQLQAICFKAPELKYLGQKAFASYVRSIHIQKDKEIFRIKEYDLEGFADSLGLPGAPRIKFTQGDAEAAKRAKNTPRELLRESDSENDDDENEPNSKKQEKPAVKTKYDRMFARQNQGILGEHYSRMVDSNGAKGANGEAEDDLFTVKRRLIPQDESESGDNSGSNSDSDSDSKDGAATGGEDEQESDSKAEQPFKSGPTPLVVDSHRRAKALKSKKKVAKLLGKSSQKVVFDDDGVAHESHNFKDESSLGGTTAAVAEKQRFVDAERGRLQLADVDDKLIAKQRRRDKRNKRRERERADADIDTAARDTDDDNNDEDEDATGIEIQQRPFEELADLFPDSDRNDDDDDDGGYAASESPRRTEKVQSKQQKKNKEREKKWFELEEDETARKKKRARLHSQPETLQDLEAIAAGLLD